MRNDYLRNPREFDGWLRANAVIGSMLAIGIWRWPWAVSTLGDNPIGRQNSRVSLRRNEPPPRLSLCASMVRPDKDVILRQ